MPSSPCFFTNCFLIFWGCPALRAGRAIAQLAGLLGPSQATPARSAACGGPATAPQPRAFGPFYNRSFSIGPKNKGPKPVF
ncbi:hypothetical protein SGRA_2670 [Saprospira grandis str. Lewin]|uniref:Secreted protein n=1 Tax=Saprospira grandis (strain Lewin) TaxID=984262 RepID=H6L870_SAPGL|nr:hypothetical protein SGRA_2670 [Saprospira grandis str. Lewin]